MAFTYKEINDYPQNMDIHMLVTQSLPQQRVQPPSLPVFGTDSDIGRKIGERSWLCSKCKLLGWRSQRWTNIMWAFYVFGLGSMFGLLILIWKWEQKFKNLIIIDQSLMFWTSCYRGCHLASWTGCRDGYEAAVYPWSHCLSNQGNSLIYEANLPTHLNHLALTNVSSESEN